MRHLVPASCRAAAKIAGVSRLVLGEIIMDRERALELLRGGPRGVEQWNRERESDPSIPDLTESNLSRIGLLCVNLRGVSLRGAFFGGSELDGADLSDADLRGALVLLELLPQEVTGAA